MLSLLFVCQVNLVRSPAFAAYVKHLVSKKGLCSKVYVDSAGVMAGPGQESSSSMRRIAAQEGITIDHLSRPFDLSDFDRFSAIFAVDQSVFSSLYGLADSVQREKIYKTGQFLSSSSVGNPLGFEGSYLATWEKIKEQSSAIFECYILVNV